jgi:hypothetical protein
MKKLLISILLLLVTVFPMFSRKDVFIHIKNRDANNSYKKSLPPGISEINIEFSGGGSGGVCGYSGCIYGLSPENLLDYKNIFKFIEDIFIAKGIPYDSDHLNKLVPGIYDVVSKAWWDA